MEWDEKISMDLLVVVAGQTTKLKVCRWECGRCGGVARAAALLCCNSPPLPPHCVRCSEILCVEQRWRRTADCAEPRTSQTRPNPPTVTLHLLSPLPASIYTIL